LSRLIQRGGSNSILNETDPGKLDDDYDDNFQYNQQQNNQLQISGIKLTWIK